MISFIIPTYGKIGNSLCKDCISSLRKFLGIDPEIIIVLDGFDQEIFNELKNFVNQFDVKILFNEENLGFSKTVNKGLIESKGEIKVLLNNDTEFFKDIKDDLINAFDFIPGYENIGIVGGRLIYPNTRIQHGGMFRASKEVFLHTDWHKEFDEAYEATLTKFVIGVTGAFFAISKKCYDSLGGLSEDFFAGHEDILYCLKAWSNGFSVLYEPNLLLVHKEGITRGNNDKTKKQINPEWFLKEQISHKVFSKKLKNFNLTKLEYLVEVFNQPLKRQMLLYYEEQRITIGIKRSGAMGDCLLVTPIIERLHLEYPGIDINILTQCPEVYKHNPYVKNVCVDPTDFFFDVFYDLDLEYEKYPSQNIVDSFMFKIFGDSGCRIPKLYQSENDINLANDLIFNVPKKFVTIHMAKSWQCRTLDLKKWKDIGNYLLSLNYFIVVLGTKNDLIFSNDRIYDLRGRTNLQECKEIINQSKLFISTDSGLFHIACTTETPAIGIFTCASYESRMTRIENVYPVVPPKKIVDLN